MAGESIEEIRKLPPEQRVKKLQEIEAKAKKELEEATKLLKQSMEDVRREKVVESIEVPEPEQVDITKLFDKEDNDLEGVLAKSLPKSDDDNAVKYELAKDYQMIIGLDIDMDKYRLQKTVSLIEERVNEVASKVDYSNLSKAVADQLVATRSVIYTMKKRAGLN